jgi:hypothetical protein
MAVRLPWEESFWQGMFMEALSKELETYFVTKQEGNIYYHL